MAKRKVSPGVEAEDKAEVWAFTVDGKSYKLDINPDHMPIRDRIDIEDYLNMPWVEAAMSGWLSSNKAMAFLAYVAMRRKRPQVELDDVLDAKELTVEKVEDEEKRPTKPRGGSGSRS